MQPSQTPSPVPSLPPINGVPSATPVQQPAPQPVQPQGSVPSLPPAAPMPMPGSQPQPTPPPAPALAAATPAIADDGDLIEKEWVVQVKRILGATAHDPFEQSKQLTKLRADYMQKRYGKSIKSDD